MKKVDSNNKQLNNKIKMKAKKDNIRISKGVYQRPNGNYTVRKQVNKTMIVKTFTNKAVAIKYYKSL